jgi:hypothetical protein
MSLWKYLGPVGAIGSAITGNQAKQKRKGAIGEAYRVNAAQQEIDQASTRQDKNEELNARGVLTAGAAQGVPAQSAIAKAVASGGKRFGSLDRFEQGASRGAVGPANTLSGGVNSALTDQFALERKDLADQKANAEKANRAEYLGSIAHSVEEGIDTWANFAGAGIQTPPQGPPDLGTMPSVGITPGDTAAKGAYGMPTVPDFTAPPPVSAPKTSFGTSDTPNYAFGSS